MKRIFVLTIGIIIVFSIKANSEVRKKDGIHKEYYASGVLKSAINYKDGKKDGIGKVYDENGRLDTTIKYKKGKIVSAFSTEPERDLGPFKIFVDFRFWLAFLGIGIALWFLFTKVLMRSSPM